MSVTGYKQRTVDFPQLKQCQGLPKTPQSVSVRVKERHRTPYSWRDADSHDGRQNEAVLWIPIKYRVQTMNVSLRPSSFLVVQRQTKQPSAQIAVSRAVTEPTHLSIRGNWVTWSWRKPGYMFIVGRILETMHENITCLTMAGQHHVSSWDDVKCAVYTVAACSMISPEFRISSWGQ